MDDGKFGSEWIRAFLQLNAIPGGVIQWPYVVGPGGGGIRIGQFGITSVTDAGAAGLVPLTYNPTTNYLYLGSSRIYTNGTTLAGMAIGTTSFDVYNGAIYIGLSAAEIQIVMGGNGWLLAKGVVIVDDEFTGVTWIVGNMGVKWQGITPAGGAIALITPSRGGIVELLATIVGNTTVLYQGDFLAIDRADGYRMYSRWSAEEAVNANKFVGLNVTVGGVQNYIGVQMDTAGAPPLDVDFCFVGGQAGAGMTIDTGDTYDTDMKVWEIIPSGTSMTLYRNGTLVSTLTTAQYPLAGVQMQVTITTAPLGASVNSQLHVDRMCVVQSRNTGVGDV